MSHIGAGEVVKWLPHKDKEFNSQHTDKRPGMPVFAYNPRTGEAETGGSPELADQLF